MNISYRSFFSLANCSVLILLLIAQPLYAASIPEFESTDTNGNSVPDYLEDRVVNNGSFTTVQMTNGDTLEWADLSSVNVPYEDVLDSTIPGQSISWREDGWRFAIREEVGDLLTIFGATRLEQHSSARKVATDLARLFGETPGCNSTLTDTECDLLNGFYYSSPYNGASEIRVQNILINNQLSGQNLITYSPRAVDGRIGVPFDLARPGTGAWLVRGDNVAPEFLGLESSYTIESGQQTTIEFITFDVNDDEIVTSVSGLPSGATFVSSTNTFEWVPQRSQAGLHEVTFTVSDNGNPSLSTERIVTFDVFNSVLIATSTLSTTHDTYSTTFAPGAQKGNLDFIRVQDVNKVSHQYKHMHRGFAQVDTTSIPVDATVATATMRLYVSEAAKPGSVMLQLPTTTWNESTLTMNNVPEVDFSPVALIDIEATDVGSYVELDVTDLMSNWVSGSSTNNGVMLSPLGTAVEFGAKESGQPIEIDVTYETN